MDAVSPSATTLRSLAPTELTEYLLEIGGTLLAYGCPTHRLEAVIRGIAALEGCEAEAFAVPTGLFLSVAGPGQPAPQMRMVRVKEWAVDLERLALVDRIFNDVLERRYGLAEARRRLHAVEQRPPSYPLALRWATSAGAAGGAAVFFRGGWGEVAVAALGGLLLGIFATFLSRGGHRARLLSDFLGGLVAGGLAWGATALHRGMSREVVILSVVILLVPGMALTTGLAELAHKNLVSGAARLMEALIVFLSILFGITVVLGLEQLLEVQLLGAAPPPRPEPALLMQAGALVVATFSFAVMFAVPRRFIALAMLAGAVGWVVTGLGTRHLPGSMAAFLAAFSVTAFANGLARISARPAQLFLVPGLILLVPGSFGFLSLEAFLRGEFLGGAAKGFEMFLIAGAIVTGLLFANVVIPARKLL